MTTRLMPGKIRDVIVSYMEGKNQPIAIREILSAVRNTLGDKTPSSSVRSYLNLNVPGTFLRRGHGLYQLASSPKGCQIEPTISRVIPPPERPRACLRHREGQVQLINQDCMQWMRDARECSIHAVVTDPPFSPVEYRRDQQLKLRSGAGGVWRIPPSFDGVQRSPLPRFTTLTAGDVKALVHFFENWAKELIRILVPGGHVFVASNPLVSYAVANAIANQGFERRGEIIRLVMTLRGGDRPKNAHEEFPDVTVMPRSMWEPWLLFRKPLEGRVQDNLRKWKTGALRRASIERPFGDVIESSPTRKAERLIAPHPSLKPQHFLRQIVRAALPFGEGIVFDPFAGGGSTLAACVNLRYQAIGTEIDKEYFDIAKAAIPKLSKL